MENRDGSTEAVISRVDPFAIDKTTVTIDQFRKFAKDTGYKTEAETFQWSFVHEKCLSDKMVELVDHEEVRFVNLATRWVFKHADMF